MDLTKEYTGIIEQLLDEENHDPIEVYDENENHLFNISQTELSDIFAKSPSPYSTLQELLQKKG